MAFISLGLMQHQEFAKVDQTLFLLYIIDIKDKVQWNMRLHAYDAIVCKENNSIDDDYYLQQDFDNLP